jgi:hypothetical protein
MGQEVLVKGDNLFLLPFLIWFHLCTLASPDDDIRKALSSLLILCYESVYSLPTLQVYVEFFYIYSIESLDSYFW